MQRLTDALELYRMQAQIRGLIGVANAPTVTKLLAEREVYLKAAERALTSILTLNRLDAECEHDATEVTARLEGLRRRLEVVTTSAATDGFRVSKLSRANVAALQAEVADLRRRQGNLQLELDRINLSVEIVLPDDVVMVLRKHRIIV